ncbi:MAG: TetR/AcrR family transcriptional regulator [Bacteroidales bacterium]|nr:TetR/AcrR family transcriptional regulator [Bacteroidales bacterium]
MVKTENTEERILEAARAVFIRKGLTGARMQEIADEAGINKALLHYYFRTKEKLFDRIFFEVFQTISSGINQAFTENIPFFDKIKKFIDLYIGVLLENPYLPIFFLNEIQQNPERLQQFIEKDVFKSMSSFLIQLSDEINAGRIRPVHPVHFIINMIGMLVIPFAVKPLLAPIVSRQLGIDYNDLLRERKEVVFQFIINAIKPIEK